jgi:hypothetical protein
VEAQRRHDGSLSWRRRFGEPRLRRTAPVSEWASEEHKREDNFEECRSRSYLTGRGAEMPVAAVILVWGVALRRLSAAALCTGR